MAEQMERLQYLFVEAEEGRSAVDTRLAQLADSVERMTERIEATAPSATSLARIAEGQELLAQAIREKETDEGLDAESRMRLRSIDVQLLRILEEMAAGRQETTTDLRADISALTKAVRQITREGPASNRRG